MDLASGSSSVEIGVGDIDIGRATSVAKEFGANAYKVDIANIDQLATILRRYDAVVNASWYEFNLHVMKACFKAGCNYDDLGGLFHTTREQLALDKDARKSGISAVVGGGESPGITNVMAKLCAKDLSTIERVKIYAGAREWPRQKNYADLSFPFSISTIIDEYSKKPVEFLNGKFVEVPPISGEGRIRFPNPVGVNTVHYSIHSETATLPFTLGKGVRNVEFKLGMSQAMIDALRSLISMGLASKEKISIKGISISPMEFLVRFFSLTKPGESKSERFVCLRSVLAGTKGRRRMRVNADLICGPNKKMGLNNATAFLTGTSASIFAQLLAEGKILEKGVIAPETAVDPETFVAELKKRGVSISKEASSS